MYRRVILLLLFCVSLLGAVSFLSLLWFYDPYINTLFALSLLALSFLLTTIGLGSILLSVIKKIYYRGDISISHITSSMRQSCFFGLICIIYISCIGLEIPLVVPVLASVFFFLSLELFLHNTQR